jgi:hypothetical protein
MKLTIDAAQGQPSFTVMNEHNNIIYAKVYACKDGTVVSTRKGHYRLPIGCRTIEEQVGKVQDVPKTDGFEV